MKKTMRGFRFLALFCLLGQWTQVKADSKPWTPKLKDIPRSTSNTIIASAISTQIKNDQNLSHAIPWAWIQENCNRRASAVNYALATMNDNNKAQDIAPSMNETLIKKIIQNPTHESAIIQLTGPLMGKQTITSTTRNKKEDTLYLWDHHVAAVVSINGKLMVVDGSTSIKPLTIDKWIQTYLPKGIKCTQANDDEFSDTRMYYTTRQQFQNPMKPKKQCVYRFMKSFNLPATEKLAAKSLIFEMEGSRQLLIENFNALQMLFGDGGMNQSTARYLSKVTPLSEKEFCKAMNHSILWCK